MKRGHFLGPARLTAAGFILLILVGTVLLMLPISANVPQWTPFLPALFTATLAVSLTGLMLEDTGTYWTPFGQAVIIVLIQLGGLGIMSLVSLSGMLLTGRISLTTCPRFAGNPTERTFYRVSKSLHQSPLGLRKTKAHVLRSRPELKATAPGQVIVWDVTWIVGHYKGQKWPMYSFMDLYSRYIVGFTIQSSESGAIAAQLFEHIVKANDLNINTDDITIVHSDNGGPMTSENMQLKRPGFSSYLS